VLPPNLLCIVSRNLVAEMLGTALLLIAVVGSGIMGDRLSGGNVALALLANSTATGAALVVLVLAFGPISGAHFNPAVSLGAAMQRSLSWLDAVCYSVAQTAGAFIGVALADLMFGEPVFSASTHIRAGWPLALSEFVATFGLLFVIWSCSRRRASVVPFAVGAYIAGAYWFTSSTSFANPAVTLARAATNTFAGIRPSDVPPFLLAQLIGATAATTLCNWLVPATSIAEGANHASV
jgi:glycerol uptake facilitator-like aquaporin